MKLVRLAVVAAALTVSMVALVPKSASATVGKPTANPTYLINTAEWSGYSMYPTVQGDTVTHVSAIWGVPKVTCPATGIAAHGNFGPRAAVWVGLTGTLASIFTAHDAWLPQIGTNSKCFNGKPQYSAVYELYHTCDLSDVPACFQGEQTISGFRVSAGDTIYASVTYTGSTSSGAHNFRLLLVDYASGGSGTRVTENVQTAGSVPLLDVARQGLVIVEDVDQFSALGIIPIPGTGGLAQFKQPVQIAQYAVNGEASGGLSALEYEMVANGGKLAVNSYPMRGNPATGSGNFTVTWKNRN